MVTQLQLHNIAEDLRPFWMSLLMRSVGETFTPRLEGDTVQTCNQTLGAKLRLTSQCLDIHIVYDINFANRECQVLSTCQIGLHLSY